MFRPGDVISHAEMCHAEGCMLQRGMYFRSQQAASILLMSVRPNAPYRDHLEEQGAVLVYEGHDAPRRSRGPGPKTVDQPDKTPNGRPTQNGLFFEAARAFANGNGEAKLVRVYEKIKDGIWVFNGVFQLVDGWTERAGKRRVFKFKLRLTTEQGWEHAFEAEQVEHSRVIPSTIKVEVWKRDKGACVKCGSKTNLHFDHDLPFSVGGSSLTARNIR